MKNLERALDWMKDGQKLCYYRHGRTYVIEKMPVGDIRGLSFDRVWIDEMVHKETKNGQDIKKVPGFVWGR